jgi:outer membrane protein
MRHGVKSSCSDVLRAAALFAVALSFGASAPARSADLVEIFRLAQSADAVYGSARASWAAAQEKLPQGRSGLLPSASLSASTQYNDRRINFRDPASLDNSSRFNSNAFSLSISQPVYRRQNIVVYEQAKTQLEQADALLAQAAQDLITRVAQAYLDVLLAQDNVALAGAQKTAIAEQLQQAKISFEVGTVTITDTHEAQARYDLSVSQEIAARSDLEIKTRALDQLIGRAAPALAPLSPALKLIAPEPAAMDKWVEEARSNSHQVRLAQASTTLAGQEVERNRSGHYPTLDAFATWGDNRSGAGTFGGAGTDINNRIIGLQLAVPIYQGGLVNSRVREALANEDKARQDLESARRTAELNARQNYLGVTSGIAQVKALEAALTSSQSALDSSRLGREVGVRTQVDVLNAQQQLFSARRDLAQAKYNYILSTLRLKAAVGRLAEEDLSAVSAWLERK